jgi:hypothetical protein
VPFIIPVDFRLGSAIRFKAVIVDAGILGKDSAGSTPVAKATYPLPVAKTRALTFCSERNHTWEPYLYSSYTIGFMGTFQINIYPVKGML